MALLSGPEHVFELANPGCFKLVGHRDVIGKSIAQALPDAVEQGYLAILDWVYSTGQAYAADSAQYDMQPAPGAPVDRRFVDFVFQPVRDANEQVEGILVMGVDTTERVLQQMQRDRLDELTLALGNARSPKEAGYAASALLGQALDVSRVGYGSIDQATDTLEVEKDWHAPGVESLAGVTQLRDYGSFIDSLKNNEFIAIPDVRSDPRTATAASALESKSARSFVNVPVYERGQLVAVFFVNCAQVRQWTDSELTFIREVGQRTRVTVERLRGDQSLQQSEARLREANESLEAKIIERTEQLMQVESQYRQSQKMEAIGQLTGGLAHDLNNLLQTMNMSLQTLQRRLESGNTQGWEKALDVGLGAVKRAASITHRMLAFSRRQTLDEKPTRVSDLVGGLRELIRSTTGPEIDIHILATGAGYAKVDRSQLENAVLNLCINARDAMQPAGGTLSVNAKDVALDASSSDGRAGDYIAISVEDTGSGMSDDVVAHAFDPFFTTKPLGQGTGLGLSMVYGFVNQSGGFLRLTSQVGQGTCVILYLPRINAADPEQLEPSLPTVADQQGSGVVLVVEDEVEIRTLIVDTLESAGYQTVQAASAAAAVLTLRTSHRIDILLTDVGLPGGLNGRQLADLLRKERPDLPVIFITGYAEVDLLKSAGLPERTTMLEKPFDTHSLLSKLAEFSASLSRS